MTNSYNDSMDSGGSPDASQPNQDDGKPQEKTPIQDIVSQIESYQKDISKVTPETLDDLKQQIMSLGDYLDNEETNEGEPPSDNGPQSPSDSSTPGGGLMIAIGKHMGGGR